MAGFGLWVKLDSPGIWFTKGFFLEKHRLNKAKDDFLTTRG